MKNAKKVLAVVVVLGVCAPAHARSDVTLAPVPEGWDFTPRQGDGDTIYLENTMSGYYAPQVENGLGGFGEDIHWDPNSAGGWSITGFSFAYFSRATLSETGGQGLTAKVDFWQNDPADNRHIHGAAPLATFTIGGLSTGLWDIEYIVPDKFIIPKDIWMSVQFRAAVDGANPSRTGLLVATWPDGVPEVGGWSHNRMTVYDEQKNLLGISWFAETPSSIFLLGIQGKKVPEPGALTLLVLGGLVAGRRRRGRGRAARQGGCTRRTCTSPRPYSQSGATRPGRFPRKSLPEGGHKNEKVAGSRRGAGRLCRRQRSAGDGRGEGSGRVDAEHPRGGRRYDLP